MTYHEAIKAAAEQWILDEKLIKLGLYTEEEALAIGVIARIAEKFAFGYDEVLSDIEEVVELIKE